MPILVDDISMRPTSTEFFIIDSYIFKSSRLTAKLRVSSRKREIKNEHKFTEKDLRRKKK